MKDLKYLMSYTIPLSALVALEIQGWFSYATVIYAFGLIPILELLLHTQNQPYTEAQVSSRLSNRWFDWMLYLNLPMVYGILIYGMYTLVNDPLSNFEITGLILSLGIVLGTNGINVAHELGHRTTKSEQFLSKVLLLPSLYIHFFVEHNYGHHKNVATIEDPATARKNQTVYGFWITSVLGQYKNAWKVQGQLLRNHNASFFSLQNNMLYGLLVELLYLLTIFINVGWIGLSYAIAIAVVSVLLLETINYIEHYGLLRKMVNGRYERVRTYHSWNSDHVVGRIVLYELTRHSDHHYRASKKYQILESKDESPRLPFGYPTSMLIALVPPLWFNLMNPKLQTTAHSD
jgi:alkane 1-monooxygenase